MSSMLLRFVVAWFEFILAWGLVSYGVRLIAGPMAQGVVLVVAGVVIMFTRRPEHKEIDRA